MLVTEFTTEAVPAHERFAYFRANVVRRHVPTSVRSDREDDFRSTVRTLTLGDLQLSDLTAPQLTCVRTPELIRRHDPEVLQVHCVRRGGGGLAQGGRETSFHSGQLVVLDSSRPYRAWFTAAPSSIVAEVPRARLSLPPRAARRALAVPVALNEGLGAVFHRWLTDLSVRGHEFTPADVPALNSVTADLLTSLLGRMPDAGPAPLTAEARRSALRLETREFIRRNLGDPSLSPRRVAEAHQISLSLLYKLFQDRDQDLPVADWIRRQRLERCRRDLADPALAHRPIHAVARRWGFSSDAHFSRAFRAAYGMPPKEYRLLAGAGAGAGAGAWAAGAEAGGQSRSVPCPDRGRPVP